MLLRMQPYQVTVKYVPGKNIPLADALSRSTPMTPSTIKGRYHRANLHFQPNASATRLTQIREESAKDGTWLIFVILLHTSGQTNVQIAQNINTDTGTTVIN